LTPPTNFTRKGKFAEAPARMKSWRQRGAVSRRFTSTSQRILQVQPGGRAIAAYRQAERMTPRDPDARANLQFARNQVQGPTLPAGRWERLLGTLSLNE